LPAIILSRLLFSGAVLGWRIVTRKPAAGSVAADTDTIARAGIDAPGRIE
jgi:hypothetical protein